MIDSQDFFIIELPVLHKETKHKDINKRSISGHDIQELNSYSAGIYGSGCLRHQCDNCLNCPVPDKCDYSYDIERELKKQIKEGVKK